MLSYYKNSSNPLKTDVVVFHNGNTHRFTADVMARKFYTDLYEARKGENIVWGKFFPYLTKRQVRLIKNKK